MHTIESTQPVQKPPVTTMSTRSAQQPDHLAYWHELVADRILPLDFRTPSVDTFEAEMTCIELAGINISLIHASPHSAIRTADMVARGGSESLIFNFLLSGREGEAEQDGRRVSFREGAGAFCNAARPYKLNFRETFRLLVLQLPYAALSDGVRGLDGLVAQDYSAGSEVFPLVLTYLSQLSKRTHQLDSVMAYRIRQNLVDLIGAMLTEASQRMPLQPSECKTAAMIRVKTFIERNINDPELSPSVVSSALRLSSRYINQLLEKEGTSLSRLIWRRRLQLIAEDLVDPRLAALSISSIALARGFNDLAHFSKAFRLLYGKTPREYRSSSSFK
ncbi:helix-turn-helix domain-containing protein [Herbaspirillum aquaticum]|jgi:AraC-like DNA-binding protein|uniref:AraC-like ligand-binding domain-containing protein n=1 Tax=Herbaspirillum aquaticum TaxID=568783 RepID=UPI0024DEF54D|nr:helix-turn-helix domain-containing protein [Herbaspirillum aquaticum]